MPCFVPRVPSGGLGTEGRRDHRIPHADAQIHHVLIQTVVNRAEAGPAISRR